MVLRSFCSFFAIWSRVTFSFFATTRRVWRSAGFRLYRQVSRSVHVAPFVVIAFMLSME